MSEIKKDFSRSVRGYDRDEVDEYIRKLQAKNDFLESENAALKNKLIAASSSTAKELTARAQKKHDKIIDEAHAQAATIENATKRNCEKMLNEFAEKISEQRKILNTLKDVTKKFKSELQKRYGEQISQLDKLVPPLDFEAYESDKRCIDSVMESIKKDIIAEYNVSNVSLPNKNTSEINGVSDTVEFDKKVPTNEFRNTKPLKTIFSNEDKNSTNKKQ